MHHADFELLPIVHRRIENCCRVPSLGALCGARAILQQALVVTSVKVVRAHIYVWVPVRIVLKQAIENDKEGREPEVDGQAHHPSA